jgi:hypothetical protein
LYLGGLHDYEHFHLRGSYPALEQLTATDSWLLLNLSNAGRKISPRFLRQNLYRKCADYKQKDGLTENSRMSLMSIQSTLGVFVKGSLGAGLTDAVR